MTHAGHTHRYDRPSRALAPSSLNDRFGCLTPVEWLTPAGAPPTLRVLDQLALPTEEAAFSATTWREAAWCIKEMAVRGAPAIGVTAAYALALAAHTLASHAPTASPNELRAALDEAAEGLNATRPTAVNLAWAIARLAPLWREGRYTDALTLARALEREALALHAEDISTCKRMGERGAELITAGARVLTHCNTGALATGGYGTALGVFRAAAARGLLRCVYADETRPYLQGARLTAWELRRDGLPVTLICDNMSAYLMGRGEVDSVWVGADRIAANGDTANKIGTYALAIIAHAHGVPLYVVAPSSTLDLSLPDGSGIPIEQRDPREVTHCGGRLIAPEGVRVENPSFDVTPHRYITAIITERGVARRGADGTFREALTSP
jgi:methylthioribose-1-phosphate isomerase